MKFKRILSAISAVAVALTMTAAPTVDRTVFGTDVITASAADTEVYTFNAPFRQTTARGMLLMINSFRTGSEAWYWNSDNSTKTVCSGLNDLSIDPELEKVAMQRAAELVFSYGHTRPDGTSCFTAYTSSFTNSYRGENIAIGYSTAESVFEAWREDNDNYSGQGHRRNMLSSNFSTIGIGHVYYGGCHYWVQEFSSKSSGAASTSAVDAAQPVSITVDKSTITSSSLSLASSSATLDVGQTASLPAATLKVTTSGTWYYGPSPVMDVVPAWSVTSGSPYVTLSGGSVKGNAEGSAVLTASYGGSKKTFNVTVAHTFTSAVKREATCTENGVRTYTCTGCGYSYTEDIPALGHNFSTAWTTDTAATCTTAGSKSHHCTRCDARTDVTEIPSKGHSFADKVVAPTYESEGYTEHTCTVCGYSYKDSYTPKKEPEPETTPIDNATVTVTSSGVYTGKALTPSVTVKLNGKTLAKDKDYTVSYKNNTNCGKAAVTVTGKGDYEGSRSCSFIIKPSKAAAKKLTSPKTKTVKLTWNKSKGGVTGYQVMTASNKKFTKAKKTCYVKATATGKTVSKLKKGTTYYAKVRAYKTVGKTKYFGAWSAIKSVKCK